MEDEDDCYRSSSLPFLYAENPGPSQSSQNTSLPVGAKSMQYKLQRLKHQRQKLNMNKAKPSMFNTPGDTSAAPSALALSMAKAEWD
eukprot:1716948-Ditylum_brightwellii.AAC.1